MHTQAEWNRMGAMVEGYRPTCDFPGGSCLPHAERVEAAPSADAQSRRASWVARVPAAVNTKWKCPPGVHTGAMADMVRLTMEELDRLQVITRIAERRLTRHRAATLLGLSISLLAVLAVQSIFSSLSAPGSLD